MSDATVDEFAVGHCRECERDALAIPDLDDEGVWRCAHCDERLSETRWLVGDELALLGYEISNGEIRSTGCTSCVSGGCGVSAATAPAAPRLVTPRASARPPEGVGVAGDRSRIG